MKIIDLSVSIENNKTWAPWWGKIKIKYQTHRFGAFAIRLLFGLPSQYLREKLGWTNETIHLSTHGATHLDAPWHYAPTSEGKPAKTIDQIPLEWCYGDGVVLDFSDKGNAHAITQEEMEHAVEKLNYTIKPGDIILIRTDCTTKYWGDPKFFTHGIGVTADATRWLIKQGVKITGIDSWGWDMPLKAMAKKAKDENDKTLFWEAHYVGIENEYCHLEQLINLDKLPPLGFKIACFPLKIKNGSAGLTRAVAIIDDSQK